MIFRRTNKPDPARPPWADRVDAARDLLRRHGADPRTEAEIDRVVAALGEASQDRHRLARTLADLDAERATRELKDALRQQEQRPGSVSDAHVRSLRQRYEVLHAVMDRDEALAAQIDATVADLERLAARAALMDFGGQGGELAEHLARLHTDLTALEAAHRELDDLAP